MCLLTFDFRLGITSTDGALWSEQRNFALRHLNRYARGDMEDLIRNELNEMVLAIDNSYEKPVQPGKLLAINVLNVLWNLTAGRKASNDAKLTCLLDLMKQRSKAFDMSGGWLNTMPFLRFIAPESTSYNLIKRFNVELCNFFQPIIDEHKAEFSEDRIDEDLIFAFINEMIQNEGDLSSNFTDTQLIMVILDFFIAGAQTTINSLDFILMLLVLNKDIQKKCHEEIDAVLGNDRVPSLKDKSSLTFIEAVILETQRLYSIIPVSGLRRVLRDTELDGYILPKDTTVCFRFFYLPNYQNMFIFCDLNQFLGLGRHGNRSHGHRILGRSTHFSSGTILRCQQKYCKHGAVHHIRTRKEEMFG